MAWRLARSLVTLRDETRQLFPGTTVWDIGDPAHAATASDHNPNECCDVVCATDTLGDGGLDLGWFAEKVREAGVNGHPAPKYVIYNRRIASRSQDWVWRTYTGSNPHATHVHVSVGTGKDGRSIGPYDDTSPWGLLEDEEDMPTAKEVATAVWAEMLNVPEWMMDRWESWPGGKVKAGSLIPSGYGHSRSVNERLDSRFSALNVQLAAISAAVSGEDQLAAIRTTIREEFVLATNALADRVAERVPAASRAEVAAAIREVLGSVDEG